MGQFFSELAYDNKYKLIFVGGCWLFGVATFAGIFLNGQVHLLDKRGKEFFKHFQGLLLATALLLVLTQYLVAEFLAKLLLRALASFWNWYVS